MSRRSTPPTAVRRAGPGRPRDPDKRLAVIAAAKELFAIGGLQGVSIDAIAQRAGISKVTLYSHFANKDALFREVMTQACRAASPPEAFDPTGGGSLRERLQRFAEDFFDLITSAEAMSLHRLMTVNPRRHRKLSQLFWEAGPEAMTRRFAQWLAAAQAAGEVRVDDPRAAAAEFFALLKGELHFQLSIGLIDEIAPARRRAQIDHALATFFAAYAPIGPRGA